MLLYIQFLISTCMHVPITQIDFCRINLFEEVEMNISLKQSDSCLDHSNLLYSFPSSARMLLANLMNFSLLTFVLHHQWHDMKARDHWRTQAISKRKPRQDRGLPFIWVSSMSTTPRYCCSVRSVDSGGSSMQGRSKPMHTPMQQLECVLDHISYSCGTQLQDYSDLPQDMMDTVFTRNLDCNEPIQRLYYSANFADICIHCSSESVRPWNGTEEFYPLCESCSEKSKIPNVKAQRKKTSTK